MNLQYISDSKGKTTGVFIPITEWNALKSKYKGIEEEQINFPDWQISEVRERMVNYQRNPNQALDFDESMDNIEEDL
jgi:hypothetical protein